MTSPLDELLPKLAALSEEEIVRPYTDPHAAAATGILVADWLMQPTLVAKLPELGLPSSAPVHLARAARAMVALVDELGGDYLSDTRAVPREIEERGQLVKDATIKQLELALPEDPDVKLWLEAIRLGSGVVDLVYDLRTLAELLTWHASAMPDSLERLPGMLRATSDAIEYALRADEAAELALARGRLARVWTLFAPAYEYASKAARSVSSDKRFPPLAVVAAHKRARRERPKEKNGVHETGSRRAHREVLELEVGIGSESNFYVGFTENFSVTGVFIATYMPQPIGSKVAIVLTLPGGEKLDLHGTVRWHRAATEDNWPGVGVAFDRLAPDQQRRIERFGAFREPMFFDA